MVLSKKDTALFYKLMWALQAYVNRKLKLFPQCSTPEEYGRLESGNKLKVRNVLYKNIGLIDEFVQENPHHFTDEELGMIQGWREFIEGEFYIERYLAKHAIFIKGHSVYAVLGLLDPFERMIARRELPVYTEAVLLPFKGRIVYDGLLQRHPLIFGRGIRSDLREIYLTAKQNNRIIESLEQGVQEKVLKEGSRKVDNWTAEVDALWHKAQEFRSTAGTPPIIGAVFGLVKASLELAKVAVHSSGDIEQIWTRMHKVEVALKKIFRTLNRARDADE